jgi:membrane protease YdiL (CAAX protease family)
MTSPEPPSQPATRTPPSKWRLAFQGYVTLIVAVVLGVLASAPVIFSRARFYAETTYILGARPADDAPLKDWALKQPDVVAFTTERRGEDLWFHTEYQTSTSQRPSSAELAAQMRQLGYEIRGMRGGSMGLASGLREQLTGAFSLAVMLAGMQVVFGIVGMNRIRAATRRGEPLPPLFPGQHGRAVAFGALAGLGLLGFGLLYEFVLATLLGHSPPSPWDSSAVMPTQTKLVFLLFGGLGAPVAEEIFFRGYLFGKFKAAGYVGFGIIFTGVLFGAVHFSDSYNVPAICLIGVCLALLYHRTGSLLAPITAHMVNNGLGILWMILS